MLEQVQLMLVANSQVFEKPMVSRVYLSLVLDFARITLSPRREGMATSYIPASATDPRPLVRDT